MNDDSLGFLVTVDDHAYTNKLRLLPATIQ